MLRKVQTPRQLGCGSSLLNGPSMAPNFSDQKGCRECRAPAIRKTCVNIPLEKLQLIQFKESHTLKLAGWLPSNTTTAYFGSYIKFAKSM